MYRILYDYTPLIQRDSVDECFCDMTSVKKARGFYYIHMNRMQKV